MSAAAKYIKAGEYQYRGVNITKCPETKKWWAIGEKVSVDTDTMAEAKQAVDAMLGTEPPKGYDRTVIQRAIQMIREGAAEVGEAFTAPDMVKKFCVLRLAKAEREHFMVMFLDNRHRLIADEILSSGTIDGASVYPREVAKRALELNAAALVFAHNHPSGEPEPSGADQRLTQRLKSGMELFDIRVLDHIVVAGDKTVSFAERGLL